MGSRKTQDFYTLHSEISIGVEFMRVFAVILMSLLLIPVVLSVPEEQTYAHTAQPRLLALQSGVSFVQQHVKFRHATIPITNYQIVVAEPQRTDNGWELMFRVSGLMAGREVHRDILLYVSPESYQVQRMFLSNEVEQTLAL
jgi:hypothetical protein